MIRVGLLIPKTNLTVEYELEQLISNEYFNVKDVAFYSSKLDFNTSYKENKEKFLKDIARDVEGKIQDLNYINIDKIYFFCTSSVAINDNLVKVGNPLQALLNYCKENNMKKVYLITPYDDKIGNKVAESFKDSKIEISRLDNLNLINTNDYFDYGIKKLKEYIKQNYKEEYGDIVISCTNLPTVSFIDDLSSELNIKIVSSNSALFNLIKKELE